MKALILAAGYATRLYPLTKDKPKALLPVNNKPIIEYITDKICEIPEVTDITVISNHKFYDNFLYWSEIADCKLPINVLDDGTTTEETRLGAIGDISFAIDTLNIDDDVLIVAGDNLFTFDLVNCFNFFKKVDKDVIVAKKIDDINLLKSFAVAVLDENKKVLELVEKPENPPSNTAIFATYLYKRETISLIKKYLNEGNKPDAPGYFVQWLYKNKDVYAYEMDGECYDVGTLESYEFVNKLFV